MTLYQRTVFAQLVVDGYPVNITQYPQQFSFQNPAATLAKNEWESSITSKKNTGFWKNNQTYFAQGAFRINSNNKSGFHGLGLTAYYDKEGAYLKRYRGYLLYAYHLKLNKTYSISGGLAFGMMSYQAGNSDYDGGTANGLDGNLGFMFYSKSFFLSANIAQLPQSRLQPINEITSLTRYYQILIGKDFSLNDNLLLRSNVNTKLYSTISPDIYGQIGLQWKEAVGLYGIYKYENQASVMIGLEKIELDGFQLRSYISYDVPINGDSRYQAFEITLQCVKPEKINSKSKNAKKKRRK